MAKKHEKMGKPEKHPEIDKDTPVEETMDGENVGVQNGENDPLKTLEKRVSDAEEAAAQSHDRLLRVMAEHDNYKKRALREVSDFQKFANESLIKDMLPIIDNLERAVESSSAAKTSDHAIVEGVQMTLKEIYKVLERFNLKSLESEGKPFDPNFHQAVLQEETSEHPENTVLKEMQKGYVLHDRLIRPAMVVVSKAQPKNDDSPASVD